MGPANKKKPKAVKATELFEHVSRLATLFKAWNSVRENGLRSQSAETRDEVNAFSKDAASRILRIQYALTRGKFVFLPAKPVLLTKKGKGKKRPVVVAPIESRIVQRALLDVIQSIPAVDAILHAGHNFGGVEGGDFGVPAAVAKAVHAAQTLDYFIRTDVQSFFVDVPRKKAVSLLLEHSQCERFNDLFQRAVETELSDLVSVSQEDKMLFPLWDTGVAQGSCLSPLLCNFLLSSFDAELNDRGVLCIRYIDDFILFARRDRQVRLAFKGALEQLAALGLTAYDPFREEHREKAEFGKTKDGFTFLGCHIQPGQVQPSVANQRKLKDTVEGIFNDALVAMRRRGQMDAMDRHDRSITAAIRVASLTIQGWGNTYSFCSEDRVMRALDLHLDRLLWDFDKRSRALLDERNALDRRRAMGMYALVDCKKDDRVTSARNVAKNYLKNGVGSKGTEPKEPDD